MIVPWTQNQVIISGLQAGADYDVTVRTLTAAGMSGTVYSLTKKGLCAVHLTLGSNKGVQIMRNICDQL